MTHPTILNPWYVVCQRVYSTGVFQYYMGDEAEDRVLWTSTKAQARLFMSLQSAVRIADATASEVLTVWSKVKAEEYGR